MGNFIDMARNKPEEEKKQLCPIVSLYIIEALYTLVLLNESKKGLTLKELENPDGINDRLLGLVKVLKQDLDELDRQEMNERDLENLTSAEEFCDSFIENGISEEHYDTILDILLCNTSFMEQVDKLSKNPHFKLMFLTNTKLNKPCGSTIFNGL